MLAALIFAALTGSTTLQADAERVVNTGNLGAHIHLIDVKALNNGIVCARGFASTSDEAGDAFVIDTPKALVYGPLWITENFGTIGQAPPKPTPARRMDEEHRKLWSMCEAEGATG